MTHKLVTLLGGVDSARFAVSLVASLGVHAGAALWADGWSRATVPEPAARSVQVRLVNAPARELLAAVAPAMQAPPAGDPAPVALALPRTAIPARSAPTIRPVAATAVVTASAVPSAPASPTTVRAPRPAPVPAPAAVPVRTAVADTPTRPTTAPRASAARAAPPVAIARAAPDARPATAVAASAPDTPPRLLAGNAPPDYPSSARRRGQQGRVLLRLQVLPDGTISPPAVVRSSGVASLDRAAVAAVSRWRFTPASNGGRAVAATVEVPVVFRLDGSG